MLFTAIRSIRSVTTAASCPARTPKRASRMPSGSRIAHCWAMRSKHRPSLRRSAGQPRSDGVLTKGELCFSFFFRPDFGAEELFEEPFAHQAVYQAVVDHFAEVEFSHLRGELL